MFISIIKNFSSEINVWMWRVLRRSLLQKRHPTCHFYSGAFVDNISKLGKYNVIFHDASVINSSIGDHSFVQRNSRILNADIGKFTSISSRVMIGVGGHPTEMISTHPAFYSKTQPVAKTFSLTDKYSPFKRIKIGNDVTIYENVLIKDGLIIGDGAVIGMGSVVTRNVAPFSIVAGNPARLIRYRFDEELRMKIMASRWWDMSADWLEKHWDYFSDPEKFILLYSSDDIGNKNN